MRSHLGSKAIAASSILAGAVACGPSVHFAAAQAEVGLRFPPGPPAVETEASEARLLEEGLARIGWVQVSETDGSRESLTRELLARAGTLGGERVIVRASASSASEVGTSPSIAGTFGGVTFFAPGPTRSIERTVRHLAGAVFRRELGLASTQRPPGPDLTLRAQEARAACAAKDWKACGGFWQELAALPPYEGRVELTQLERWCALGRALACSLAAWSYFNGDDGRQDFARFQALAVRSCELGHPGGCLAAAEHRTLDGYVPIPKERRDTFEARARAIEAERCQRGSIESCPWWGGQIARFAAAKEACEVGRAEYCPEAARLALTAGPTFDPSYGIRLAGRMCDLGDGGSCHVLAGAIEGGRVPADGDPGAAHRLRLRGCFYSGGCSWW